jgi:hypothetical protein
MKEKETELNCTFSTAITIPSQQRMPIAVPLFSTALVAYSSWKILPSGENVPHE